MFRDKGRDIIAVYDAHDPGVLKDGTHLCPCGFQGDEDGWYTHLEEQFDARFSAVVQLPMEMA